MDEHNGETIRRTSSGAPMPPPIALGGARGGAVAAGEQQQMQSQSQMPNPSAAPATTTSATMASSSASPSRSASAALNGYSSDDCGGGSRSARMRAVRAGRSQPFFIGVAGGTASGKTTVVEEICQRLHDQCVVMLSQDSFYRGLTKDELANVAKYNFDVPSAFDVPAMVQCLRDLRAMRAVDVPVYDFTRHARDETRVRRVEPADVVVVEGILVLQMPEVREFLNMRVFVDTDDDVRLARRIQRDVACRGRDVASVIEQYTKFVKPAFDSFVAPSRKHADVVIPWGREESNVVAIDLISQHIRSKLQQPDLRRLYHNLEVVPSNFQVRGMHTIVRDAATSTNDFVFYADRLLRLVVEAGLGFLPFEEKSVTTPTGATYVGVDFAKKLCGVSVIRSGESMENALRACCKGIKIGKILVHRTAGDRCVGGMAGAAGGCGGGKGGGETAADQELLIYEKLPRDIADRHVLLMDPILGSGNSATRAIRVLLDRGVDEGRILFLTLIAAPEGIHRVCGAYPRLKLVTSEIDAGVDPTTGAVSPGIGEFGDRYFST